MAKKKKIDRYVPSMKLPANGREWASLDGVAPYDSFNHVMSIFSAHVRPNVENWSGQYYDTYIERFNSGEWNVADWRTIMGDWRRRSLLQSIWTGTPEYKSINDAFLAEFDSRDDLQEIYQEAIASSYYFYDLYGNHHSQADARSRGWDKRPLDYRMFRDAMARSTSANQKVELARETPYLEGDLVVLRKPHVGRRDIDPLYIHPYSEAAQNGATIPDSSVLRIGTVIGVTDRVAGWRASKGSKVIQLIWMGSEDMVDVEEKYIKWHERPTYKNGMKKRPENRE